MNKAKYQLGQQIYKYDFESNSIEELMINQVIIEQGAMVTLGNLSIKEITTRILYRLANKSFANQYTDIAEFEINKTFYFSNKENLKQHLLGCYKNQNKLS